MQAWIILGFISSCCEGFLVFALFYLRSKNQVSIGDFAFVIWSATTVLEHTWWIVTEKLSTITKNIGICKNGLSIMTEPHDIIDLSNAPELNVTLGAIAFQNVHFMHHGFKENIFNHLSIQIEPGAKVGLVGYSGSGKSTFIHLLVRLFDLNQGKILIDHQNIATVTQNSLRSQIGFIPQDPTLFH